MSEYQQIVDMDDEIIKNLENFYRQLIYDARGTHRIIVGWVEEMFIQDTYIKFRIRNWKSDIYFFSHGNQERFPHVLELKLLETRVKFYVLCKGNLKLQEMENLFAIKVEIADH